MPDFDLLVRRVLEAAGMAEAAGEALDLPALALELHASPEDAAEALHRSDGFGFVLGGPGDVPVLTRAGRQFLRADAPFPRPVLTFLSDTIDDLHARQALLLGGTVLVDEFREALLGGRAVEHAQELVPPAFRGAVDERLALDLYAAAVALMARLSSDHPAGCVAEEILAVALLDEAEVVLDTGAAAGRLTGTEQGEAAQALRGLFDLFQDDDTLALWDMAEPADAAVAGQSEHYEQQGVVDQRVEAWLVPFGWTAPTGYLDGPP
jgi:PAS domain-containing protein